MLSKSFARGYGSVLSIYPANDEREVNEKVLTDEEAVKQDWQAGIYSRKKEHRVLVLCEL
jgi:hypothetical protein